MRFSARLVLVLVLSLGAGLGVAYASSVPGDRASTEATLADLEKDPSTRDLTAEAVKKSRDALERGARMRAAGDDTHARLAEGVAAEWANEARELARAAELEKRAAQAHKDAQDASVQSDRERAMLEQRVAENGRLIVEIALALDGGGAPPVDASAPKPAPKAAKKAGGK